MATRIGVKSFCYAKMTSQETADAEPSYADPVKCLGVISISINPNGDTDTLFADDGPFESAVTMGQVEVGIEKAYLTTAEKAALLGKKRGYKDGGSDKKYQVLVSNASDVPPYVAIAFKSLKSDGRYRYVWLYKGKFADPETDFETKADSIEWGTDSIDGKFTALMCDVWQDVNGMYMHPYKIEADQDDCKEADYGDTSSETYFSDDYWFGHVVMPPTKSHMDD